MRKVEKVYAYITSEDQLLVFKHVDFPEAGIQVPGSTLDAGETPEAGVLREAGEETGLRDLVVEKYLGRDEYIESRSNQTGIMVRYFFHLTCPSELPETPGSIMNTTPVTVHRGHYCSNFTGCHWRKQQE